MPRARQRGVGDAHRGCRLARSTSTASTTTSPSAPRRRSALTTFTIETWFRRDGAGVATSTGTGGLASAIPLVTKGRGEADQSNVDANWFLGIDTKGTTTTADDTLVADFEDFETPAGTNNNHPVTASPPSRSAPPGTTPRRPMTPPPTPGTCTSTASSSKTSRWAATYTPRSDSIQHAGLGTAHELDRRRPRGFFDGALDEVRIWNVARSQSRDPGRRRTSS